MKNFDLDYFELFNNCIANQLKEIFYLDDVPAHLTSNALYDPQTSAAACVSGQALGLPAMTAAILFMALESIAFQTKTPKLTALFSSFKRKQFVQHGKILASLNNRYASTLGTEQLNSFANQMVEALSRSTRRDA